MRISVGSVSPPTAMQYELPSDPATRPTAVITVSQLLRNVRDTLERRFPLMWVRGELSNLSRAPSGHCYFTLKDDGAQVDCVMFKSRFAALDWEPANGAQVEARALVSLYRTGEIDPIFQRWLAPYGKPGPLLHAMFYLNTLPE